MYDKNKKIRVPCIMEYLKTKGQKFKLLHRVLCCMIWNKNEFLIIRFVTLYNWSKMCYLYLLSYFLDKMNLKIKPGQFDMPFYILRRHWYFCMIYLSRHWTLRYVIGIELINQSPIIHILKGSITETNIVFQDDIYSKLFH